MQIDLSKVTFENDIFSVTLKNGEALALIRIDEEPVDYRGIETKINRVLIVKIDRDGNQTVYSSVIGMKIYPVYVDSKYPEYQGKMLTEQTMAYCTLETGDL